MHTSNNQHHQLTLHPVFSKITILLFSLILALIFTAYSNHFYNDFHFDDSHVIQTNTYIQHLKNIPSFFKDASLISSLPSNQQYRPMVATTLAIDYWLANGLNPFWFHVSIFTWFIIQCVFLYFFFLNIVNKAVHSHWNVFFALFAMALYGVHPANAETINYICARSDSMSTCWLIIAFVTFIKFPSTRLLGAHLIPLIIACLFKQTALVFPALLFLYVLFFEEHCGLNALFNTNTAKPLWINLFKSTGLTWLVCIVMYIFVRKMDPASFSPGGTSIYLYLITQPFVMVHYFLTLFLPLQLSIDTDWTTLTTIIDDRFYIGISFIMGLITYAFYASKKQQTRPIAFGILWFFIALLPTSSFIPLAEVMNDHRLFFPLIGLLFATCYGVYLFILSKEIYFKQRVITKWIVFTIVLIILGGHAYGTYQRNIVWKTEESLWYDNTLKNPKNGRGLMNYGLTQMKKGNYLVGEQYFLNALNYTPTYGTLHINLGVINEALGRNEEAEKYYENAIRYDNNRPSTLNHYARFNLKRKPDIAEQALLKSISLSPGDMDSHHLLMHLYWEQQAWVKLNAAVNDALKLSPTDQISRNYAHISEKKLDIIGVLLEEIEQHPTAENYLSLSLLYFEKRNYPGVIQASKKAIKINPQFAVAYNNACAAYNELEEYTKAELSCKKAIAIDPSFQLAKNNLQASLAGKLKHE